MRRENFLRLIQLPVHDRDRETVRLVQPGARSAGAQQLSDLIKPAPYRVSKGGLSSGGRSIDIGASCEKDIHRACSTAPGRDMESGLHHRPLARVRVRAVVQHA